VNKSKNLIIDKLERIITLLENIENTSTQNIKQELERLHDWKIKCETTQSTRFRLLQILRWTGPWILALFFVIFEKRLI